MSGCDSQHDITPAFRTLRQRCSDIGLPTWHFDAEGGMIAEPELGEDPRQVARHRGMQVNRPLCVGQSEMHGVQSQSV